MRIAIVIILTFACCTPAYSQIKQKLEENKPADYLTNSQQPLKADFDYRIVIRPNDIPGGINVENLLQNDTQFARLPENNLDGMPCYKPVGVFSMRIIKPDSTVTYTMLHKKY